MEKKSIEEELDEVKKSLDLVNKTIKISHGEIGLGVLLAVTFTFGGLLLTTKVWEQSPPWQGITPYNGIVSSLGIVWLTVLVYVLISRWRRRHQP